MVRVFVEAAGYELFERSWEFPLESWGVVFGYEEKCSHRVQASIGGFPLSQLNCRDPKWPDISLKIKKKKEWLMYVVLLLIIDRAGAPIEVN